MNKFEHPCKDTCSGWQQGFDRGREVENTQGDHFTNEEHTKVVAELSATITRLQQKIEDAIGIMKDMGTKDKMQVARINQLEKHIDQMSCCCSGCTKHNANIDTTKEEWTGNTA